MLVSIVPTEAPPVLRRGSSPGENSPSLGKFGISITGASIASYVHPLFPPRISLISSFLISWPTRVCRVVEIDAEFEPR